MSYILDALRKAERERRTRQTPRPDLVYLAEPPARRSRRAWLLGGALLGVMALAAWLGWPESGPVAPSPRPAVTKAAPTPAPSASRPGSTPAPPVARRPAEARP